MQKYKCKNSVYLTHGFSSILVPRGEAMFKVSKPEMVNKTFRMPAELVERLNVVAQAQKVALNNLVCQCYEYALDNLSDQKEDTE